MTELTETESTRRAAYIQGLRELAGLLTDNPDIPLPWDGRTVSDVSGLHLVSADADRLVELLGRPACAEVRENGTLWVSWRIAGLSVLCSAGPCEREVTGVRVIGGREVQVTEYTIPERFQPLAEEKAQVPA